MEQHQATTEPQLPPPPPRNGADDLFREVNDRIMELGQRFGFREEQLELICECGDASCTERVSISEVEFAEVRAGDRLHLVVEGHTHTGRVVRRGEGYLVVGD